MPQNPRSSTAHTVGALLGAETVGTIVGELGVGTAVGANVMRQHDNRQVCSVSSRQSVGLKAEQIMLLHSLDRCSALQRVGDPVGAADGARVGADTVGADEGAEVDGGVVGAEVGVGVVGAKDGVGASVGASVQLELAPVTLSW